MELTLEDVCNTKVFVKNGSIDFKSPREYIMPFVDQLSKLTDKFIIRTSAAVENAEEASGVLNTSYGRVLIEAQLPENLCTEESGGVIGLVYGLDVQKPVMKVYSGQSVYACVNLCVFGAEHLTTTELLVDGSAKAYVAARQYTEDKEKEVERYLRVSGKLKEMELDKTNLDELIGKLLRESMRIKLVGTTPIISATKDLYDPKSKYAVREGVTTGWNVYNAVTDYISHKNDILDRAAKTVLLEQMFLN